VPLLNLRIALWRARPVLRITALIGIVVVVIRLAAPDPPSTAPVIVAAHALQPDHVIEAEDLTVVRMPTALVPEGLATQPDELIGRRTMIAIATGLPVSGDALAGQRFAVEPPHSTVVAPLALEQPAMLRPGDRIDVLASGCERPGRVVSSALVVDVDPDSAQDDGYGTSSATPVLVAITEQEANELAAVYSTCTLMSVLVA
jgi:pilus assembly protein CpaB